MLAAALREGTGRVKPDRTGSGSAPASAAAMIAGKRAVLFDLYHTLTSADSVRSSGPGTSDILGVSREDWNRQVLECSRDRLVGKITDPKEIIRGMAHAIDPAIPEETIARAAENRARRFENALLSVPEESVQVLGGLRRAGKKTALVSNADVVEARAWPRSPIAGMFDAVLFSCDAGFAKPEPEIYMLCLERIGLGPEECAFVGDGGSWELRGARECGITTVMMTGIIRALWPERVEPRKAHADFVIERLSELVIASAQPRP